MSSYYWLLKQRVGQRISMQQYLNALLEILHPCKRMNYYLCHFHQSLEIKKIFPSNMYLILLKENSANLTSFGRIETLFIGGRRE